MFQLFRTLRFRLLLLFVASFAALLLTVAALTTELRRNDLLEDFDQRLAERARTAAERLRAEPARPLGELLEQAIRVDTMLFADCYLQLTDLQGVVLARSANLGGHSLGLPSQKPVPAPDGLPASAAESISGERARQVDPRAPGLRVLTLRDDPPGHAPIYIQVASSLESVERRTDALRGVFYTVVPPALIAAGVLSWLLVQRSLSPIGRIAREARALTAAHLDRRIAMPSGRDEVAEMVQTINGMLERLEAAFRAQERFVANAAHELKTPLTVLLAEAQVLAQRAREPQDYRTFAASVQDEARRLAQVTDSLLMLARADAGLPLPQMTSVSVNEAVTDAVQRCNAYAVERGVRIVTRLGLPVGDAAEPTVRGDAELLRTMIDNLIRNAIRHSPGGAAVEVTIALDANHVRIAVRDHGPGVPQDATDQVFERFFQLHRDERAPAGTGLGLAIARGVARLHQGDIAVRNMTPHGCEFTVTLRAEDDWKAADPE